jgi:hypothetical protein
VAGAHREAEAPVSRGVGFGGFHSSAPPHTTWIQQSESPGPVNDHGLHDNESVQHRDRVSEQGGRHRLAPNSHPLIESEGVIVWNRVGLEERLLFWGLTQRRSFFLPLRLCVSAWEKSLARFGVRCHFASECATSQLTSRVAEERPPLSASREIGFVVSRKGARNFFVFASSRLLRENETPHPLNPSPARTPPPPALPRAALGYPPATSRATSRPPPPA